MPYLYPMQVKISINTEESYLRMKIRKLSTQSDIKKSAILLLLTFF